MKSSSLFRRAILAVILGALIFAAILAFSDLRSLGDALAAMAPWYIPLILVIMPFNFLTRYFKFHYYLRALGYTVKRKDELIALASSFIMVLTPAKLGEMLLKGYMLMQKYDVTMEATMAMTLAERITDGFAMAALAIVGLAFMGTDYGVWAIVLVCMGMLAIVLLVQNRALCGKLLHWAIGVRFLRKYAESFARFYESSYCIFSPVPLLVATLWGIAAWLCEALVLLLSVQALGGMISYAQAMFAVSFSGIAGAVSMIPGGLLVSDGTILGLLVSMGQDFSVSGAATLISRFSTMWLGVGIGAIALIFAKKNGLWDGKEIYEKGTIKNA